VTSHATTLQQQAEDFQKRQSKLDSSLQEITYTSTSDEATQVFEPRMLKIRRLEVATSYLELVREVDQLRIEAQDHLKREPRSALSRYRRLKTLSQALHDAQPDAEGAAPQLIMTVEETTKAVHDEIKSGITSDFQSTLEKINWPQQELDLSATSMSAWFEQADLLLELQEPDLVASHNSPQPDEPMILLPLEIMTRPLAQRFRYHFYGDRPTNRLDKPEYFFSHILDLLDRHADFVANELQPILDRHIQDNETTELVYTDATSAFITALLPLVIGKSLSILPKIASHSQLLSHFMHEVMSFDESLRESWNYSPSPGIFVDWKGVTWELLDKHGYFQQWLKVEKEFALARYCDIRDAEDSGEIDYEGVERHQTKPTKGTIRVNDLLETVTDRYRGLSSFSQKMKFLIGIQLSIFDNYHAHMHGFLQAYLAQSHTAGRLLQGQYSKGEAFSQKALASLCKIYGSAEYLERKMSDWSDDVFFLELWEELQDRVQANSGMHASVGKDLRVDEVAAKTSASIKASNRDMLQDTDGGALFDETALAYRRLKEQSEAEILRLIDNNIREAVADYGRLDAWASLSTTVADITSLSPSSALDSTLQVTSVLLKFLSKVVARPTMHKLVKHLCATLQTEIYSRVITPHNFSAAGVTQLQRDIMAIEEAIDSRSNLRGVASSGLKRLEQMSTLLGLPIKRSGRQGIPDDVEDADDAWGFEGEDETDQTIADDELQESGSKKEDSWSLWDAEKEVFKSNEAARRALADMGLDFISESEARNILKRRIELSS
jgi:RAD50-interacting protein 1